MSQEQLEELLSTENKAPEYLGDAFVTPPVLPEINTGVCFTSITTRKNYVKPFSDSAEIQCKTRDAMVKAFAGTAIVLKGTGYFCKFMPHPVLQVSANVFDVGSWMVGAFAYSWSLQPCTRNDDPQVNAKALKSACYELRKMGLDCRGVAL